MKISRDAVRKLRALQDDLRSRSGPAVPLSMNHWGLVRREEVMNATPTTALHAVFPEVPLMEVRCPSACCLAGEIVLLEGAKFIVSHAQMRIAQQDRQAVTGVYLCRPQDSGDAVPIIYHAQNILGLTSSQALELFQEFGENARPGGVWWGVTDVDNPIVAADVIDKFIQKHGPAEEAR